LSTDVRIIKINAKDPDPLVIREISKIIQEGGLIAFPTDTVYGIGGTVTDRNLVKIKALKRRQVDKPIGLFAADMSQVKKLVSRIPNSARILARWFWPGSLTLVFAISESLRKTLSHQKTIGIRIPDQKWLLSTLKNLRKPILQTSANISGRPPAKSATEVIGLFGHELRLVIDAGRIRRSKASTVVDVSRTIPIILREGAIGKGKLQKILKCRIDHIENDV
jgi:L-threonylcarbamoyladenylate synthase